MSELLRSKSRYRTTNWRSYNAALKARSSLTVWLNKDMQWFAAASSKRGRCPKFSDAVIPFCLAIKNLFALALRQAMGFVESLLNLSGLHWPAQTSAPSAVASPVCKFMCRLALARQGCICSLIQQASSS